MASVHRIPDSKYWHGAFRQGGHLIARSTKQVDRTAALRVALEWERAAKIAERGELTEAKSREVLAAIMERAGSEETIRSTATDDFLSGWLASKANTKSAGTAERYRKPVNAFLASLGAKARRPLGAVVAADVERFLAARLKSGISQSTARLDVKILGIAFARAMRQGLIPKNPVLEVELPAEDGNERGTFTAAEVGQLIAAGTGEWPLLIRVAYFTGQRLSDCVALDWQQIDLSAATIRFQQRKTGAKIVVPIHPDLLTALEALPRATSGPVLPELAATSQSGRRGVSETFKGIVKSAGLDLGEVKGAGNRKFNTRTFHSLRHSFTSALANAGVTEDLRMKLTGHKSTDEHRGYSHHELKTLAGAMAKMPGLEVVK